MDPNANLQAQERILLSLDDPDLDRLTELRRALSTWLACEGFEPDWTQAPVATLFYTKGRIAQ
jgi:hypothetical protein